VPSAIAGLGSSAETFKEELKNAIHDNYPDKATLDKWLLTLKTRYAAHSAAVSMIDDLIDKKAKLCVTYTRELHTMGHTATVRAESMNASLKCGGGRAKDIPKYNMSELFQMYCSWESKMAQEATKQMIQLLETQDCVQTPWGSWVKSRWEESRRLASRVVKGVTPDADGIRFYVRREQGHTHEVCFEADKKPTCDCSRKMMLDLPCPDEVISHLPASMNTRTD